MDAKERFLEKGICGLTRLLADGKIEFVRRLIVECKYYLNWAWWLVGLCEDDIEGVAQRTDSIS